MDDTSSRRVGAALVAAQFALMGLLGVLALLGLAVGGDGASAVGFVLAGAALGLAAGVGSAALAANRPGNFNIRPVPREGGRLVTHGIYRWI
ncbi:MAG: hypothetical protein MUC74_12955, partial [Ideonella sp.]|nr:hypothetical protein [Ideonella sp.]